ncbi:MAG: hypothetical protein A2648_01435 [Candidatus Lloydbacteria bacterium RIFCSPHIGHO2_01_FULL_41_20]|uniref:Uncharacterized protein n=1 Tax=Candidatus Lloydbacteria bacterium RIFCSPHIGHO2_01_FULL_41_20 TaxID=1798657 RepID=A0A1G2CSW5_9BACT|nr:MAG: hypothetical protein A2648_01435 [Candidatus Lloydbacteria bacterium RIFCSPHIGHO2_01_FULL_41_20]
MKTETKEAFAQLGRLLGETTSYYWYKLISPLGFGPFAKGNRQQIRFIRRNGYLEVDTRTKTNQKK